MPVVINLSFFFTVGENEKHSPERGEQGRHGDITRETGISACSVIFVKLVCFSFFSIDIKIFKRLN